MAIFEPQVFYEKVQANDNSFIFLFGDEIYLQKQAYQFVLSHYQVDTQDVFNFESFDLTETPWEKISDSISQLPMMASFRSIVVRGIERITEKDLEQLEHDLTAKDPKPLVIFMSTEIDKKKKIYKLLSQKCLSCEFKPPYENQIPQWVHYIAEQKGLKINQDAIHTLVALVGTNLSEVDSELEKIALYIAPAKNIEESHVSEVLGKTRHDSVFSFIEELYSKHHVDALVMLADLLGNGQSEVGLISLLARHLRILLQAQSAFAEGLRGQALAQRIGVSPYFLGKYLQQSTFWSAKDLNTLLLAIAQAELQLKSVSIPSHFILENLMLRFYDVSDRHRTSSPRT